MAGASVELIGRRPKAYFDFLPQPRRKRVIDRIRRWYLHHFPSLGEDCAQEACARLLASASDLKTGPEPMTTPSSEWYEIAEKALVRFATGLVMRNSVVREMYVGKGLELADYWLGRVDVDCEDEAVHWASRSEAAAYTILGEQGSVDDQLHWTKVVGLLRDHLVRQADIDPAVLQIFDQLCRNAEAFERPSMKSAQPTVDIVRGESFQINHIALLESLQRTYPDAGWDLHKVRLKVADLGRDASRVEEGLAKQGVMLFGARRSTKGMASVKQVDHSQSDVDELAEIERTRGAVS